MRTLVYDGDCGFCTSSVRWVARLRLAADEVVPYQHADLVGLGLTERQCQDKVQWVDAGRVSSGHVAVARLFLASALPWKPVGALLLAPGVSWVAARVYDWVSANRTRLPGGTPACALPPQERPEAG